MIALFLAVSLLSQFQTRYADYAGAVRKLDVDRYMSYFADDFSMRSPDGKFTIRRR